MNVLNCINKSQIKEFGQGRAETLANEKEKPELFEAAWWINANLSIFIFLINLSGIKRKHPSFNFHQLFEINYKLTLKIIFGN